MSTQGEAVVTDADREKAMFVLFPELESRVSGYIDGLTFSDEAIVNMRAIAAALAEEREKARAHVVAAQSDVLVGTARALTQSADEAPWELRAGLLFAARVVEQTADRIRRAAEVAE